MSETVSRLYATAEAADAAITALKAYGFTDLDIFRVAPTSAEASLEAIAEQIMKSYELRGRANALAQGVADGGTVVSVKAQFGFFVPATRILDAAGPVESSLQTPTVQYLDYDEAAPLSSILGLPVLMRNSASLSSFLYTPAVTGAGFSLSGLLGLPALTAAGASFSKMIGLGLITRNRPAALSSLLGLPVLL